MSLEKGVTRTGETYRLQRQHRGHVVRASFTTREEANAYSLAVTAAWAAGAVPPSPEDFKQSFINPRTDAQQRLTSRRDWTTSST